MAQGYLIFHLNLAFSSIKTELRPQVIQKCYWPLLELAESTGIPIGIELTGWTLQQIQLLDESWVQRFREMLARQQCELIGSGWSQLIGPLVPYEVNRWNQALGLEAYQQILGTTPRIALVNEMAFSTGLIDVYVEAGYRGIVMDRDNVRLALGLTDASLSATPTHAQGCANNSLPVLWCDSILFQRLQRVVHGDIPMGEYLAYVSKRCADYGELPLPIYCNDAEIFDFRPGRFTTEATLHQDGEWLRMKTLCNSLRQNMGFDWVSPSTALETISKEASPRIQKLTSIKQPIPVKKQAKYNINRWALSGRDDLRLNTACHRIHRALMASESRDAGLWRNLCELWASDLRTHITDERWKQGQVQLSELQQKMVRTEDLSAELGPNEESASQPLHPLSEPGLTVRSDADGVYWTIETKNTELELNARRGLAIKSLSFKSQNYRPTIGTLAQGHFDSIELGADFYSGGMVIEIPASRRRLTDLEWVNPRVMRIGRQLHISAELDFPDFKYVKTIALDLDSEKLSLKYDFGALKRPLGTVRVGFLTLVDEAFKYPLIVSCKNGGESPEFFALADEMDHGRAVSPMVSSTTGLGATDGMIIVGDADRSIAISWCPAKSAVVPMLINRKCKDKYLTRIALSLCELDDTSRDGGGLTSVEVHVVPGDGTPA